MSGESIIIVILVGLVIGSIASFLMGGKVGLIWCVVLGLVGSAVGNYLFHLMGWYVGGIVGNIVTGVVGACVVIFLARRFAR